MDLSCVWGGCMIYPSPLSYHFLRRWSSWWGKVGLCGSSTWVILSLTLSQTLPWNPVSLPTQTLPSCMYVTDTDLAPFVNHCSFHSSPLPLSLCFFSLFSLFSPNRLSLPPSFFTAVFSPILLSFSSFLSRTGWRCPWNVKQCCRIQHQISYGRLLGRNGAALDVR